jgi:hypothetical protein
MQGFFRFLPAANEMAVELPIRPARISLIAGENHCFRV